MLIMGSIFHQVEPVLSLAAALSIQTPFTNRAYRDSECEVVECNLRAVIFFQIVLLNITKHFKDIQKKVGVRSRRSNNAAKCVSGVVRSETTKFARG